MTTGPDVLIENHGSIILFRPLTPDGDAWIENNIGSDAQYFGDALAVEHRYAEDIAEGMMSDGLTVGED